MERNILFSYLYRDAGNYKKYSSVIFSNRTCLSISDIQSVIRANAVEEEWFIPAKWDIPKLAFETFISSDDHELHEIDSISMTEEKATKEYDIGEFLELISREKNFTPSAA